MTTGAQIDKILDDLRACTTAGDVHRVADHHRLTVKALSTMPKLRVRAIHIANLKNYRLLCLRNGWG